MKRTCQHCRTAVATLRILHDGNPVEGMLSCVDCWELYEEERAKWLAAGKSLFCDACRREVDVTHLTAEPLSRTCTADGVL